MTPKTKSAVRNKILHVGSADKFIPPFMEFVSEHFDSDEHDFLLSYGMATSRARESIKPRATVTWFDRGLFNRVGFWWGFFRKANSAKKLIFHGLFDIGVICLLAFQPWLLRRSYWVIWGGDLYAHKLGPKTLQWRLSEFLKKKIVPRFANFVTHVKGDYELASDWYGANGQWHECFLYPSNLYAPVPGFASPHDGLNILLGNSATESNNHLAALKTLCFFSSAVNKIYCPLSYGEVSYADRIDGIGKKFFGPKFIALRKFMPLDEYYRMLQQIDVAVFNHDRQQAMGNITTLLGLGKTVYMRSDLTSWNMFASIGVKVFDIKDMRMQLLTDDEKSKNIRLISDYFSIDNLVTGWGAVFREI